jgi:Tfp pilus assembly protein PilO
MADHLLPSLSVEHERHWWALLPKPVLFVLLTAAFAVALWHEVEWRREVNETMRSAASREDLKRALDEVKEIRVDQLRFYAWQAERAGDWAKAAELHAKLLKETKETTP